MRDHDVLRAGGKEEPGRERPAFPGALPPRLDVEPFIDRGVDQPLDEWGPLDEFGLPMAWRRKEPFSIGNIEDAWHVFETWAKDRKFKPFPADPVPVALFLADPPVSGAQLRHVWEAVDLYHSAFYWHEGANPVLQLQLGFGVFVSEDGVVTVEGSTSPPPDD